jgi:D-glycero-D-manno-heptose 1,7-bisphosphate phosphatase
MTALAPDGAVIVLDRDGTLIDVVRDEETGFVGVAFHPSHVRLLKGVAEGLRALAAAGYRFALATNQPGPAKGQFSREAVAATNAALLARLDAEGIRVEHVAVCLHHEVGGTGGDPTLVRSCECRKPKPGLIVESLAALGGRPERSWMIGDSVGDIRAGLAAGVRTAMVFDTKRCELCPLRDACAPQGVTPTPDVHGANLVRIAERILADTARVSS